jgi:metal-sulfur cluster biosynthetic enzyme
MTRKPNPKNAVTGPMQRREFLTIAGVASLSGTGLLPSDAQGVAPAPEATPENGARNDSSYWDRTDRFEEKLKLLEASWRSKDFRLARALAHSLRNTVIQAQAEEEYPGVPLMEASRHAKVESLPAPWRAWAQGWAYCKVLTLRETTAQDRPAEPVEVLLSFPAEHVTSLAREIRVARIAAGVLSEVPCQVHDEVRRDGERLCKVMFMASSSAGQLQAFFVFYGNADAELPEYSTDLVTKGEGFGLDIENEFYKVSLSRQMGQLERMVLKREQGLELFSGGEGHGEPPGIDWAHDYVDSGNFQKLRITLWDTCPDCEVVRGPLATIVRRWGFPYSPVHPVFSPSRLLIDVEYRFYAGLPWFHKSSEMRAVRDFEAEALRDDEWVFSGQPFTDTVWMGSDGKLRVGDVDPAHKDDVWGVGFFNRQTNDSFIALFLAHKAEGLPEPRHSGAPMLHYRWHGHVWSRYPLPGRHVPAGAVLHQKNAYVAVPFSTATGARQIEELRRQLVNPLVASAGDLPKDRAKASPQRLARPGEAGDSPIPKALLWNALRDCKDAQLYTADINIVDLGLVYDIRVRGDVVHVVMAMPHRGRPRVGYFAHGSVSVHPTLSMPARECLMKVAGVRKVVVTQTWEPAWSSNQLTNRGRQKLGL